MVESDDVVAQPRAEAQRPPNLAGPYGGRPGEVEVVEHGRRREDIQGDGRMTLCQEIQGS